MTNHSINAGGMYVLFGLLDQKFSCIRIVVTTLKSDSAFTGSRSNESVNYHYLSTGSADLVLTQLVVKEWQ